MLCYQYKASDPNVCNLFTHTIYFSAVPKFCIFLFNWSNFMMFILLVFTRFELLRIHFIFMVIVIKINSIGVI
jgi:hypothetical protein